MQYPDEYQLLKVAGVFKTLKKPFKRLNELLRGTDLERLTMSNLRQPNRQLSPALEREAKGLRSKYRRRQLLTALGLTGAASTPLLYKALDKRKA